MERYAKIVIWESFESDARGAENAYLWANFENFIKLNLNENIKATVVTITAEHLLSCIYHTAYFLSALVTAQYNMNPMKLNNTYIPHRAVTPILR